MIFFFKSNWILDIIKALINHSSEKLKIKKNIIFCISLHVCRSNPNENIVVKDQAKSILMFIMAFYKTLTDIYSQAQFIVTYWRLKQREVQFMLQIALFFLFTCSIPLCICNFVRFTSEKKCIAYVWYCVTCSIFKKKKFNTSPEVTCIV